MRNCLFICVLLMISFAARAELKIEITEGVQGAAPIAVIPFGWSGVGKPIESISDIIANDLARSGRFAPMLNSPGLPQPTKDSQVRFDTWKNLGMDHLVIGRLRSMGPDSYVVQFQLFDVYRKQQLAGYSFPTTAANLRRVAHNISDIIYEKILGVPGAFSTLIAYVSAHTKADGRVYSLRLADADGFGDRTILNSNLPIMSPSWSPDATRLAYVSFENRKPAIYIQNWVTAERNKVSSAKGINGAPVWSPDGRSLAMTLSKDGNPEIYILDIASKSLRRVTRSSAVDTEPAWMPDGRSLVFTSDRSGNPQLYTQDLDTNRVRRLTFEGQYNASATVAPDGKQIAMVHMNEQRYRIAVLDMGNKLLRILSEGGLDESPSFAPNGSMVLYAVQGGRKGELGAISIDGRMKQRISFSDGDVREPAWSPFLR